MVVESVEAAPVINRWRYWVFNQSALDNTTDTLSRPFCQTLTELLQILKRFRDVKMIKLGCILAVIALASASDVLDLGDDDFESRVGEHDLMLVEFFAPWWVAGLSLHWHCVCKPWFVDYDWKCCISVNWSTSHCILVWFVWKKNFICNQLCLL